MMDELELSPDSNDLLIDEDSHGDDDINFEHSDSDLNMDLLDHEDGEEDQKAIQSKKSDVEEEPALDKDDKPTEENKSRTPIVFKSAAKDKESHQISSSVTGIVSVASAPKVGRISPETTTPAPTDFGSKIGMTNVWLNFSEGDLKVLKTYHDFYSKYKPIIISANPTAPMPKINMVVASKWKEFLNVRKATDFKAVAKDQESPRVSSSTPLHTFSPKGGRIRKATDQNTDAFNKQDRSAASVGGTKVNLQFQRKPNPSLFSYDQQLNSFSNGENRVIFGRPSSNLPLPPSNGSQSYQFSPQQGSSCPDGQGPSHPMDSKNSQVTKLRFGSTSTNNLPSSNFGSSDQSSLQDLFKTRVNDMSISDIECLLAKKKKEDMFKRQRAEEEAARKSLNASDTVNGSLPQVQVGNLAAMMKQQMEFQRSMMAQMLEQQNNLAKQRKEMEAKRETDELKFEIKKLELMLTMNQGQTAGGVVDNRVQQNPGSVRARVGPKNPLKDASKSPAVPASQRVKQQQHTTWSNNSSNVVPQKRNASDVSNKNGFKKWKKFTNDGPLPPELILTNLSEKGPVPAAGRVGFVGNDNGNWKRRKTVVREDEDVVVKESLSDEED